LETAKNYLDPNELNVLNRIVTAYLEIAELQALNRKPMYMRDWIDRLDDFLKMTGNEILSNAGAVSNEEALQKAHKEYQKKLDKIKNDLSQVEKDFIQNLEITSEKFK